MADKLIQIHHSAPMKWLNVIAGLVISVSLGIPVRAQNNWVLQKKKDGIQISNRPAASSSFNDVRVEVDLPGTIEQLAAILQDVPTYTQWSYATKKSILTKTLGPGKFIYYSEIEVPWPATNRFFYAIFDLKTDPYNRSFQVVASNLPDYQPETKDLVKVPFTKGVWNVTSKPNRVIHIDYILQLNPGGSLPAWVLNLFSTKGPLETFENIREKMMALNP
jgi:hypothetical protein